MTTPRRVEKLLYRTVKRTCEKYDLLAPGDRIAVALSGGKDSYGLLVLLSKLVRALPFPVELLALHLDQRQPGYDGRPLMQWLERSGHPFEILSEDTYGVVTSQLSRQQTYCSLCSRLRRGILYSALERTGFNKLALGHHRDDAVETLMMNLLYSGRLQAMPASYTTDDGRYDVIRPLIECAESWLQEYAELEAFPILPCNLCGSQEGLRRERIKSLLDELEREQPNLRSVMLHAIGNVRPTHLLDRDLARAWAERAPEIRPKPAPTPTPKHMTAQPVHARRLKVI